jgi:hypothetical protein
MRLTHSRLVNEMRRRLPVHRWAQRGCGWPARPPPARPTILEAGPVRAKRVPPRCSSVRRDELHHCPVQHVEPRAFVYKLALVSFRRRTTATMLCVLLACGREMLRGRRNARRGTPSRKLIKHGQADSGRRKGTRPAPALITMSVRRSPAAWCSRHSSMPCD